MVPSRLFRSRWSALVWAGGILWTAYDVASDQPQAPPAGNGQAVGDARPADAMGQPVEAGDLSVLANAMR